jgi:hypothetical protein
MALHQADFSITTNAFGYGEDDLRLRPVSATRAFKLAGVTFETDDGAGNPALCIRELDEDEDTDGTTIYTDGDQLFFITTPYGSGSDHQMRSPTFILPRTEAYEEDGTWISAADAGDIISSSRFIRVEVTDGGSSKTYTGTVFYETAGDYRF